jgi:hypothetical protein
MSSQKEGSTLKRNQAQESIGSNIGGNTSGRQRTRRWSKALRLGESQLETAGKPNSEKANGSRRRGAAIGEGKALKGVRCELGEFAEDQRSWQHGGRETADETARTPWLAAR